MSARLAASVALRIASGTSRALPWPKPTRPFSSPTMTSAANPNRRPPFTTLATRLMWTSLSVNSLSSRSRSRAMRMFRSMFRFARAHARAGLLEFEATLAGGLRKRLDATVIPIAAAVEDHRRDALADRTLGHQLADRLGGTDIGAGLEACAGILFDR